MLGSCFHFRSDFFTWLWIYSERETWTGEIHAKRNFMKKKSDRIQPPSSNPHIPVDQLFQALRGQLRVTYETMAAWSGLTTTTLHNWSEGAPVEQVEALIQLLARVPVQARHDIFDKACPPMPSLAHPYIARDRMVVGYLDEVLRNRSGTTVVQSQSEYLRSFVATALAHSLAGQNPNRAVISGYDIHAANWFVPIDGVEYLNAWKQPNGLEAKLVARGFKPARMAFLNGVYSRAPGLRAQAQRLSATTHVVISDRSFPIRELEYFGGPKHVVTVSIDASADSQDDAFRMAINVREVVG
jgi:DNA-binding transcriptional regulator YiaG